MPIRDSSIDITDQFCGAGGSSIGATNALKEKGGKVKLAMNHWNLAVETHNVNFPDTVHHCTDIQACDPRWYPSTTGLITSPECTNHSPAKGKEKVSEQLRLFETGVIDPAEEKSRATMWDVTRFAEYHKYEFIIVENVVNVTQWVQYPAWLLAMKLLGYNHKAVYANSMHFHPTPQSRDRVYIVFWKKGNHAPKLDLRPTSFCTCCSKDVASKQAWKNPLKKFGKYKTQYIYVCPVCMNEVEPYYYASFNIIDWSNIGTMIGDRKKPLSENTERRIRHGLEKYGKEPFVPIIMNNEHTKEINGMVRSMAEPMQTQCTWQTMSMAIPKPYIINMNRTGKCSPATNPCKTFTAGGVNHAVLFPPPFIVVNKGQSNSKSITDPASTQTTNSSLAIVTNEAWNTFIHYNYGNTTLSKISDAIGTVTTRDRCSIVSFREVNYEHCYYRMLFPSEIQSAMAFHKEYVILGTGKEQVRQLGNAVTPPVMEWLVTKCIESLEK